MHFSFVLNFKTSPKYLVHALVEEVLHLWEKQMGTSTVPVYTIDFIIAFLPFAHYSVAQKRAYIKKLVYKHVFIV